MCGDLANSLRQADTGGCQNQERVKEGAVRYQSQKGVQMRRKKGCANSEKVIEEMNTR